jgi:hypothetical protein
MTASSKRWESMEDMTEGVSEVTREEVPVVPLAVV